MVTVFSSLNRKSKRFPVTVFGFIFVYPQESARIINHEIQGTEIHTINFLERSLNLIGYKQYCTVLERDWEDINIYA